MQASLWQQAPRNCTSMSRHQTQPRFAAGARHLGSVRSRRQQGADSINRRPQPQPQQGSRRGRLCVAAASHSADDFASRLRRGAASRLKQAAEQVEDTSRRAAQRINRTLNLPEQGRKAQAAVSEGTAWVDQRFKVKRRLRLLAETVQQDLPKWRRQLRSFNESRAGQVFWTLLLAYSLYSGVFFTVVFGVLRALFLLSWIMPLLLVLSARQFGGQMAAQQAAQQRAAAAAAQQQAARRNPFAGFGSAFGQGGSPFGQGGGGGQAPGGKPGPNYAQQPGGPVIDAEWETIDEGDR